MGTKKRATTYITAGAAQRRLGISANKMTKLLREGVLPWERSKLNGRLKLVKVADVDLLLAERDDVGAA